MSAQSARRDSRTKVARFRQADLALGMIRAYRGIGLPAGTNTFTSPSRARYAPRQGSGARSRVLDDSDFAGGSWKQAGGRRAPSAH